MRHLWIICRRAWITAAAFTAAGAFGDVHIGTSASGSGPASQAKSPALHYADVVLAAEGFDTVLLWEGLPHPFEKSIHAEMAKSNHFTIGGELFYDLPLVLHPDEQRVVSHAVIGTRSNFKPWSGFKLCGGFHADYAVEWRKQGITLAQALICFTCGEARFFVGHRMENVDLSKDGRAALRALLWPHHFLRPRPDSPILKPPPLPPQSGAGNREAVPPPGPQPPSLPEVDKTGILDH